MFQDMNVTLDPYTVSIGVSVLRIIGSIVGALLARFVDRKPVLLFSSLCMAFSLAGLGER